MVCSWCLAQGPAPRHQIKSATPFGLGCEKPQPAWPGRQLTGMEEGHQQPFPLLSPSPQPHLSPAFHLPTPKRHSKGHLSDEFKLWLLKERLFPKAACPPTGATAIVRGLLLPSEDPYGEPCPLAVPRELLGQMEGTGWECVVTQQGSCAQCSGSHPRSLDKRESGDAIDPQEGRRWPWATRGTSSGL